MDLKMQEKIGVVLLNLGGPDSLEAVEPFLYNLFVDPDIINFPGSFLFREWLAKLISSKRHPKIQEQYKQIGGKSPLKDFTLGQAKLLEEKLNEKFPAKVYAAIRYLFNIFFFEFVHNFLGKRIPVTNHRQNFR